MTQCEHGVSMSDFCSDCVGFNPVTCSPACDWCGDPACGFCARQGARCFCGDPLASSPFAELVVHRPDGCIVRERKP